MSALVFVVSIPGFEGEMEAVAAFTTYNKANKYLKSNGITSWAIKELKLDEECHEETNV
ncbi:hypothetical protein ACT0XK_004123 [Cronobacter sakazakii]|uniref:hypothetical protein n=1 Tax=Cronobacter sakazakii TaxID=28141 RepID=UPI0013FDADAB|nr:hypothetical protein [Cronobacter sakazakii]EJP5811090.1 hypothetical protein [Cronobacter sakazakii]EJX4168472.1 hypothetical protein [Cronobacter sakazakii]EJY8353774.1 hypothetical protein [Cronobacter sakazakii]EJY8376437.1 hypothetical protein [Cronobacter sakazakii]EKC5755632.1 hypothetical protein [Cronobacter sakazakii]